MIRQTVAVLLFLASSVSGQNPAEPVPTGIYNVACFVKAIQGDVLEARTEGGDRPLRFRVTRQAVLEEVDMAVVNGKVTMQTRLIALGDLRKGQPLNAIVFSDGQELLLLRGVASGPQLSGSALDTQVRKLGGTLKRNQYDKKVYIDVRLSGTETTDGDLLLFGQGKDITSLDLSFTRITDKGIAALARWKDLNSLNLAGTGVTDTAVVSMGRKPLLNNLNVAQTAVTARALAAFMRGRSGNVCKVALGDKAHYRVHEEYVRGEPWYNFLMIGDTYFGRYYLGKVSEPEGKNLRDRRREATTYYHRAGPAGQVFMGLEWFKPADLLDYPSDVRLPSSLLALLTSAGPLPDSALVGLWSEPPVAVIGLNVGTHAAYGRPWQRMDFYNSVPETKAFCLPPPGKPASFGFVQDALKRGCAIKVWDGPERSTLNTKAPKKFYQAMFVEITRTDLRDVNTDLLTQEAVAAMMSCLTETGVLCFHTSHRYHQFFLPIIDAAQALHLTWKLGNDVSVKNSDTSQFGSQWVMIARHPAYLRHLADVVTDQWRLEWTTPPSSGKYLWHDRQPHDLAPIARPDPK